MTSTEIKETIMREKDKNKISLYKIAQKTKLPYTTLFDYMTKDKSLNLKAIIKLLQVFNLELTITGTGDRKEKN